MSHRVPFSGLLAGLCVTVAVAGPAAAQRQAPPPTPFRKVSELVPLPEFIPGLGTLFVDPATLPAGPFLAYDRGGRLVSTIYMLPLSAMQQRQDWSGLSLGSAPVDHVDVVHNPGHAGVAEPHYHVILWHVSREAAARLSES